MLEYFKKELVTLQRERLNELIEQADGVNYLAKMLNIHYTTIKGWVTRGRISKKGARMVEANKALGEFFKAKYLRPDL